MNAFFMEDPEEPGKWAIPIVVMEGKQIMLNNIRKDRLDFFRPLVAAIAKKTNSKAYFIEYDIPSRIDEIQPVDNPHIERISSEGARTHTAHIEKKEVMELIEKIGQTLAEGLMSKNEDKSDEETVH